MLLFHLSLALPSRGEANHPRVKTGHDRIHSMSNHRSIANLLKFFQIVSLVAELAVFETVAAIARILPWSGILIKRHQTALAVGSGFHNTKAKNYISSIALKERWINQNKNSREHSLALGHLHLFSRFTSFRTESFSILPQPACSAGFSDVASQSPQTKPDLSNRSA